MLVGCIGQLASYGLRFLWVLFCPKALLAARLLAAESQLAVCKNRIDQKKAPRPGSREPFACCGSSCRSCSILGRIAST